MGPDLLLKKRRSRLQKQRGSRRPPPPCRHLRLLHQEVHLQHSQEEVPLPRPPGPPHPPHTRVALEADKLRVKCSLAGTPQSTAARSSPASTPPSAKPPLSMSAGMSTASLLTIENDTRAKPRQKYSIVK